MGTKQEAVVLKFIGAFGKGWPEDLDAALSLLSEDASYQMVVPTTPPTRGRAAIASELRAMMKRVPEQRHELKSVGSGGNCVFTERVDHSLMNGKWASIPLMAVFELNDRDEIVAWREYLDPTNVARQLGVPLEQLQQTFDR